MRKEPRDISNANYGNEVPAMGRGAGQKGNAGPLSSKGLGPKFCGL